MSKLRVLIAIVGLLILIVPCTLSASPGAAAEPQQFGTPGPTPTPTAQLGLSTFEPAEVGEPGPQIILVMDVSESMLARVIPSDPPPEVAALQSQLKEIEESTEVREVDAKITELEESNEIVDATEIVDNAYLAVEDYFPENGLKSAQAVTTNLERLMAREGCITDRAYIIVTAEDIAQVNSFLNEDCGYDLDPDARLEMIEVVAYVEDPVYTELISTWAEATKAQRDLYTTLGYFNLLTQRNTVLASKGYGDVATELETLAVELGYPNRLELAKVAASTMIDLSRLDDISGDYQSRIGLIMFSSSARVVNPLTDDFDTVDANVQALYPYGATNIASGLQLAMENFVATNDPDRPALIVLMSDGQPTPGFGYTTDQILARLAPQISEAGVEVCTAGFATTEAEIDAELMEQLAVQTDGEYGFARTGEELLGFFVKCRQSLLDEIASALAGNVLTDETADAGTFEVPENTGELKVTLNWLEGDLELVLIDPEGNEITEESAGYSTQRESNVQLSIVTDPMPGTWTSRVRSTTSPEKGSIFNILVSLTERQITPTPEPTITPTPEAAPAGPLGGALPYVAGICLCLLVLLGVIGGAIFFMRRKPQAPPQPSAPMSYPASAPFDQPPVETEAMPPLNEPSPETEAMDQPFDPNATVVSSKSQTEQQDQPPKMSDNLDQTLVHKPTKEEDDGSTRSF